MRKRAEIFAVEAQLTAHVSRLLIKVVEADLRMLPSNHN